MSARSYSTPLILNPDYVRRAEEIMNARDEALLRQALFFLEKVPELELDTGTVLIGADGSMVEDVIDALRARLES